MREYVLGDELAWARFRECVLLPRPPNKRRSASATYERRSRPGTEKYGRLPQIDRLVELDDNVVDAYEVKFSSDELTVD